MEQRKPKPKPRARNENSTNNVGVNEVTQESLPCTKSQRLLPGVNELLGEVKNLKVQLSTVKEERDEYKEEATFLKYQLAYRAQVVNLQKEMNDKKKEENKNLKKPKAVRFSSNLSIESGAENEDGGVSETNDEDDSLNDMDRDEYNRLQTEKQELEDVLYDFYHDSKMGNNKGRLLFEDIESDPSESVSSFICRVLVDYEKLNDEHRILEEEKSKLDEDKGQLCSSMAKLREQFHDAVDSNIEEIEDLNRQNEELRFKIKTCDEKDSELRASFVQSREQFVNRLKAILELSNGSKMANVTKSLNNDIAQAEKELKEAKSSLGKLEEEKASELKRAQSLPSSLRQETFQTAERGGLLRELGTCKDLQESQRKQIQKIQEEKLDLEVQLSEIKRQNVLLKAERRANIKTRSKLAQTDETFGTGPGIAGDAKESSGDSKELSRRCKDLERKLEEARREKSIAEEEKTCLLMSLDANIEKKDALEEQLNVLQAKLNEGPSEDGGRLEKDNDASVSETDGVFQASYKKDISEAKVGIEKIRIQEQDKQITILKRENEAVKEKLKRAEDMLETLQNCLKELTDEKHELLDSVEELNEEKAELEETRLKLEKELGGTKREKFVADEVSDIRNKERKLHSDIEASKAKLSQLDLKVVEVLSLISTEEAVTRKAKNDSKEGVDDMIGSLLSAVDSLKLTAVTFKKTYDKTKSDSLRMKDELQAVTKEKSQLGNKVEELEKKIKEIAASLENKSKSQASNESSVGFVKKENLRLEREVGKMSGGKVGFEKSLAEARRREGDLERQLKDVRGKRDALQNALDQLTRQCQQTTSLLAETTKEVEESRRRNDKLTKELEHLQDDLEGTVEDRDELVELLDRIVCENGSGEGRQGLGLKVERIRERNRSEEHHGHGDGKIKAVEADVVLSSQALVESSSPGDDELFVDVPGAKNGRNGKTVQELLEENKQLKEMVEKMINGQKKMEMALSSFSEANAEIQQDLDESIEHTEQIRVQGSEETSSARDFVDYGAGDQTMADDTENAELRRLHEAMVGTNEALMVNLRRLQEEKTRAETLRNSWQEISRTNANLESNVEGLSKDKASLEKKLSALEGKRRELEKQAERALQEKQDLKTRLDEAKAVGKDIKFQVVSLTQINQELRESKESLNNTAKVTEKKWSKLNDDFDELEFENDRLEKASKRLHQQLSEVGEQKTAVEMELGRDKEMVVSLKSEVASHSNRSSELQSNIEAYESELKLLRETAAEFSALKGKANEVDKLKREIETLRNTAKRVQELEENVSRLGKEMESSQRCVKDVSEENVTLRDSLSVWEREAGKIRQHVHQVSQEAERHNESGERCSLVDETPESVKAFEAMQVEMDAINEHLKSLTDENKELSSTVERLTKENDKMKDRNIQLLTRYDMVSKEVESKVLEINKLNKSSKKFGLRGDKKGEAREKLERENKMLQTKCGKLERDHVVMKSSLTNALDEEKVLRRKLKNLIDASRAQLRKPGDTGDREGSPMDIGEGGLTTAKPDLIRHSKDAEDGSIVSGQGKYKSEYFTLENGAAGKDTQELARDVLKECDSLKRDFQEMARIVKEIGSQDAELRKEFEEVTEAREKMNASLENSKAALEKTEQAKSKLENGLEKSESELSKVAGEKTKLRREASVVKEKTDKLQTVFRALIQVMNDKKGDKKGGRQTDESEGPTSLIDYVKNIKTKYTGLVKENEDLEGKVEKLQKEIEQRQVKQTKEKESNVRRADSEVKKAEPSQAKSVLEEKERVLKELLLTSARDKRRFVEKLQELFDEFTRIQSQLDEEVEKQREVSPATVVVTFEKVNEELVKSLTHTETFIQSVVHERRVTVIADNSSEKDTDLELAKENEELIGRISSAQTNRRKEVKNLKDELRKSSKEKEVAVKATDEKWKNEMETARQKHEKTVKEKELLVSDAKNSWKEEVTQLKHESKRLSDEHEKAQRTSRNESRLLVEKMEEKNKLLKAEVDKVVAEKKENDSKMAELRRKTSAEAKERTKLAESEVEQVRSNWADSERKLRSVTEEKQNTLRELERVNRENAEQEAKAKREMQKLRASFEHAQKQSAEREDFFKRERERLQRTTNPDRDEAARKSEENSLERNQSKISGFQRNLDGLVRQNKLLVNGKLNAEQSLGAEQERLREENSRLQREQREQREQRRVVVNSKEQSQRMEPNLASPPAERVKVLGSIKQATIDKPRLISPLESAPASFPGPRESQRRVKVRESQTAVIHKGRVQEQSAPRNSVNSVNSVDPVFDELDAVFQHVTDPRNWDDAHSTTSVIQATPIEARTQGINYEVETQPQMPQPEWGSGRGEITRAFPKDPRTTTATWQQESSLPAPSGKSNVQPYPQRTGYAREELQDPAPKIKPKPIKGQAVNSSRELMKSSSAENLVPGEAKRPVAVVVGGRNEVGARSRPHRRPSIGSDDVFVTSEGKTLMSHGGKNGDFCRSQSLDDLTETSNGKKKVKMLSHQNTARKHKPKLPKSFSGPKKLESHSKHDRSQAAGPPLAQQHGRSDKNTKAKQALALKGMEYVIFQHQI